MGFSQCIYWVFTIGISLRRPIKGTKLDGKLNLLLLLKYLFKYFNNNIYFYARLCV